MNAHAITGIFGHIATDWIVLIVIVLVVAVDSMRSGSSRAIALSIALPITAAIFPWLGSTAVIGAIAKQMSTPSMQAMLFAALLILIVFIVYRMVRTYGASERPLQALLTGVATAAVVAVVWMRVPVLMALWHPTAQSTAVFGAAYGLLWLVAALFTLALSRG